MENTMTISYESVLYAGGSTTVARGFADLHYDKSPSPLTPAGGGTNSILGPGGIVNVLDDVIQDGTGKNWGSAAFKLVRGYQKNKNVNLMNLAQGELVQAFTNALRGGSFSSALNQTFIPYRGTSQPSFESALPIQTVAGAGSVASNGFNLTKGAAAITGGVATSLIGNPTAASTQISGLLQNAQGLVTGGNLNKVINLTKASPNQLTASSSNFPPVNTFNQAVQTARTQLQNIASADNVKSLQENLGKNAAFLQQNIVNNSAVFQTGTNNLLSEATNAFANTPLNNLQFSASSDVASRLSAINLQSSAVLSTVGKTSTNAEGSGFVNGTFGSVST
jgi:hypothetical protein